MNSRLGVFAALILLPLSGHAATFNIINGDGPGEGFNDTSSRSPVGNNPETTLGDQRMFAVQWAANIWGALLESPVTIDVIARWDDLECSQTSGVLGSAGPRAIWRDFSGAQLSNTWYPEALANALFGSDLDSTEPGIGMTMNSRLDDGDSSCLGGNTWYYGLDDNTPSGQINVLPTILHELAHGLGFTSFVDLTDGSLPDGFDDVYMVNLSDTEVGLDWTEMTDAEREASAINNPNLVWTGPEVQAMAPAFVTSSSAFSGGFLRMHAPDPLEVGSSVSHWTTDASPDLLMEPILSSNLFDQVDLTIDLFADIGWTTTEDVIFENGFEALP